MSTTSPVAPIPTRDIRSASVAYKRDKDHSTKWAHGVRSQAGKQHVVPDTDIYGEPIYAGKVRPENPRPYGGDRVHSNRTRAHHNDHYVNKALTSRLTHKVDAITESNDTSTLTHSLLSILPQHANNTSPAITAADPDILFSFDNKGPSPGAKGNRVALDGLIEKAEQRWIAEQTEKLVRGEYEVLDVKGETVRKGKRSPRTKAEKSESVVEDEGFELI